MSLQRGARLHVWMTAVVVAIALVAGHVVLFRSLVARFGRTALIGGAVAVVVLVKLGLVLMLRRRAGS